MNLRTFLKNDKSESIKKKIIKVTIITNSIAFILLAGLLFFMITSYNIKNFDDKVIQNQNNLDQYLIKYFDGIETSINTFELSSDIKSLKNNNVTSYIDKSDSSGKVKMTPLKNGPFEAALYNTFKDFLRNNPAFVTVGVACTDNGGYMQYPAEDRNNNYDPRERPWYKNALDSDEISYTNASITTNGKLSLAATKKIKLDDKLIGVLNCGISLNDISDLSQKYKNGNNGFVIILDKNGTIISHGKNPSFVSKNIKDLGIEGIREEDFYSNTKKEVIISGNKYKMYVEKSEKSNLSLTYLSFVEKSELTREANDMLILVIIAAVIVIIILSLIFIKVIKKYLLHIVNITNNLNRIGSGDLTVQLDHKELELNDEIGVIARAANNMQNSIKDMLFIIGSSFNTVEIKGKEITNASSEIKSAANQVFLAINDVSQGVLNQAENLMNINSKLDLFSEQIDNIVAQINNLEKNSKEVKNINDHNKQIMTDLLNTSDKMDKNVKNFDIMVINLNSSIFKIADITNIINSIAEQTDLLALNAAIEASRVGETGNGFAVVADEIRKLAEGSKKAVLEINNLVIGNLNSMKELMSASKEVGSNVSTQVNIANEGVQAFYDMNEKLEEIMPQISFINNEAVNINNNKNSIFKKVEEVASVSEEVSATSEEIVAFSQGLEDITVTMNQLSIELNDISIDVKNGLEKFKFTTPHNY